jgi:FkbM family methyltransferase
MKLPAALEPLRQTRVWQKLRNWRYLRHHRPRCDFYRQFIAPGALVFDIGANVGHYALIFHHLRARIVAIEPQAELADGLRRRFASWQDFTVVQTALGAATATATLHKAPGQSEIASLRPDVSARSRFGSLYHADAVETVPVTTLDALIRQHGRPDFCKIDVEGFESEVLSGLSQSVPQLSFEVNREYWEVAARCLQQLSRLGDYRFNYALGEATTLGSPSWLGAEALTRELAANSDLLLWGDIYARLARETTGTSAPAS